MGFILGLVALVAAYFEWQFFYNDATFDTYIKSTLGQVGSRWKIVFWISVAFAIWAMVTFVPIPAYVSLLIFLAIFVLWLSSPAGQKFLKDLV